MALLLKVGRSPDQNALPMQCRYHYSLGAKISQDAILLFAIFFLAARLVGCLGRIVGAVPRFPPALQPLIPDEVGRFQRIAERLHAVGVEQPLSLWQLRSWTI